MSRDKPYYDDVFERCRNFADGITGTVPELAGIAIVPIWRLANDRLPAGITILAPDVQQAVETELQTAAQLLAALQAQCGRIRTQLQSFDTLAGQLAGTLQSRHAELQQIEETIRAATT